MNAEPPAPKLTENGALAALLRVRDVRQSICVPRYSPSNWGWECDLFETTRNGYFAEWEIKTSRADFLNDRKKCREGLDSCTVKHLLLAQGSAQGPAFFNFVTPAGLVKPSEVPSWAGLWEISWSGWIDQWRVDPVKPAPRLHKVKLDPAVTEAAKKVCYYRFHDLLPRSLRERRPKALEGAVA